MTDALHIERSRAFRGPVTVAKPVEVSDEASLLSEMDWPVENSFVQKGPTRSIGARFLEAVFPNQSGPSYAEFGVHSGLGSTGTRFVLGDELRVFLDLTQSGFPQPNLRRIRRREIDGRLSYLMSRQANWNGEGAVIPSPLALAETQSFLNYLGDQHPLPSAAYAPGDGEIALQWRNSKSFIEVAFNGTETISWYSDEADAGSIYGDDRYDVRNPIVSPELMGRINGHDSYQE